MELVYFLIPEAMRCWYLYEHCIVRKLRKHQMINSPINVMQLVISLSIGGTEKLVYDYVKKADKRVISSIICCLDDAGALGIELEREGYHVEILGRRPGIDYEVARRLAKVILANGVSIIHAHQYTPYFYGFLAAMNIMVSNGGRRPGLILTEHGLHYPYKRKLKRYLVNPLMLYAADEIITICEYTKKILIKYDNYPQKRTRVIYNGVDVEAFRRPVESAKKKEELGLPSDSKIIGIVARLDPVKNHSLLFRAFNLITHDLSNTFVMVVGEGPEENKLKALAQELGIADRIRFLGSRRDISELLHICDVFVLPSISEGMPVTLIEAMASGVPTVATCVGGNCEVVRDGITGFIVRDNEIGEISNRILTIINNKELGKTMGQAGAKWVGEAFNINKTIDSYTETYMKIAAKQ
jgi:L-malate glycosyltransferase